MKLALTLRLISDAPAGEPTERSDAQSEIDAAVFAELFVHAGGMVAVLDAQGRFVAVTRPVGASSATTPRR